MVLFFGLYLLVFLVVVEFLSILLRMTGMNDEKAKFQVISLLTSTGFTTAESETIMRHPARRKIAQYIMLLGYVSLGTFVAFLATTINTIANHEYTFIDFISFTGPLGLVILFLNNRYLKNLLDHMIERYIMKHKYLKLNRHKLYNVLNHNNKYSIYSIPLDEDSTIIGQKLLDTDLRDHLIQVLNVDKGHQFIPFPKADYVFEKGDVILAYGRSENMIKYFKL